MLLCDHDSSSDTSSSEDDLEDLLLTLNQKPKRILGPRLNLEDLTNLECEQLFRLVLAVQSCVAIPCVASKDDCGTFCRFSKDDMARVSAALHLPEKYVCKQGTTTTGMEALMIMLRRLTYPDSVTLFPCLVAQSVNSALSLPRYEGS